MVKKLIRLFRKIHISRTAVIAVLFVIMSFILIRRLYTLQIVNGEDYYNNFSVKTTKTLTLKSSRGNIYDRNGEILASNELSYSLTITDASTYKNSRTKALAINGEIYRLRNILLSHGDSFSNDFHVILDHEGNYAYDVSGTTLQRFKADVYGCAKIESMTTEQADATAEEMMAYLISEKRFGIIRSDDNKPYTEEELTQAGLPKELSREEILDITYVRYELFTTSFQKYVPVTIATDLSDDSVAQLQEIKNELTTGIEVQEDSIRVYDNAEVFSSILGYTGKISSEELTTLKEQKDTYNTSSIVGKTGIENIMETTLQGTDGQQTVYVDNLGQVTEVDTESVVEPVAGNDVYLTIDKNLQIAAYKILEQRIAGILVSVIINDKYFDMDSISDRSDIRIPIYDVYNALIENSVIDISHFTDEEASRDELALRQAYNTRLSEVTSLINDELYGASPSSYSSLSDEIKAYEDFIINDLLMDTAGIINKSAIDTDDEKYIAWTKDGSISMREYLTYAASQNWIDISSLTEKNSYVSSDEAYALICQYVMNNLSSQDAFTRLIYKYLLLNDKITPENLINILYDQGILDKEDDDYEAFVKGDRSAYDLMIQKINSLEITPGMLALEPCSGSVVITDPNSGEVLACVTYPGYDNNRLANTMDTAYYRKLVADGSQPLYSKATQQRTAPGSTFKLVTTAAGLEEGVIETTTTFNCTGVFDLTETPLACWLEEGHGELDLVGGIQNSCNVYFGNVAYRLGTTDSGTWSDSLSLGRLQKYAELFDLDKNSGIELSEADPQVSTQYAIQSAIGQGTHAYTTTQLARYVSTLANGGTSYQLSLLSKVTDNKGKLLESYTPDVQSTLSFSDTTWQAIHSGLKAVIDSKQEFINFGVTVAGKTGTAQSSSTSPSHALFICYAPYEDPQISMAVRIANGYSSTNAMMVAHDILAYYFDLVSDNDILSGDASTENISQQQND